MRILLINLDRSPDRLAFQQEQAERIGIELCRLPAVDALELPKETLEKYGYQWRRPLSSSEVACLLSHKRAWQDIAQSNETSLVLEDDVVLSSSLGQLLDQLPEKEEPIHWNLEGGLNKKLLARRPIYDWGDFRAFNIRIDRGGAAGYVLTPAAASQLLVEPSPRPFTPADDYLNSFPGILHLQVEPSPLIQLHHVAQLRGEVAEGPARSTQIGCHRNIRSPWWQSKQSTARIAYRRITSEVRLFAINVAGAGNSTRRRIRLHDELHDEPRDELRAA